MVTRGGWGWGAGRGAATRGTGRDRAAVEDDGTGKGGGEVVRWPAPARVPAGPTADAVDTEKNWARTGRASGWGGGDPVDCVKV